jgi:TfoX/Sxy family transcriptional regulator of competence genes
MKMPKPSEADLARFRSHVPDDPRVEIKPMFGQLAAFVNGNMFMGLFGSDVGVRLPDEDRDRLMGETGAGPFGPAERPMGGYVTLPGRWLDSAEPAADWIARALEHTASLPPKQPKARKRTST